MALSSCGANTSSWPSGRSPVARRGDVSLRNRPTTDLPPRPGPRLPFPIKDGGMASNPGGGEMRSARKGRCDRHGVDTVTETSTELHTLVADIYRDESRRVFATLVRLLRDFDLAEEALHEAFAAA